MFSQIISLRPLLIIFLLSSLLSPALPLYTRSRWIENDSGVRVKLACVNWVSHLDAVVTEGLSNQPLDALSKQIRALGFNCVRLTWALFLATNSTLANHTTVQQSLSSLHLQDAINGFRLNNPTILNLSLIDAFKAVVSNLGDNNVMVILDNHISKPGWCCSNNDDNGFFGDKYFNPETWFTGLATMASIFRKSTNVVGMSLRNELRGPKQNIGSWYKNMQEGAEVVHSANPNVLVILSGLNFDKDLSFLKDRSVNLSFSNKLVLEVHWYSFTDGSAWKTGNTNQVCGSVTGNVMQKAGFLLGKGFPLFVSEFGSDLRGINANDNRYLSCFLSVAADLDFDWALWTLVGGYYFRQGVVGMEEFYGLLNYNWSGVRNSSFLDRISVLQTPLQGPGLAKNLSKLIFHPLSGKCMGQNLTIFGQLILEPCSSTKVLWSYTREKILKIKGTHFCLEASETMGEAAKVGIACTTKWDAISESKLHLSTKLSNGTQVCLDVGNYNDSHIVTTSCKCLGSDNSCDPASQWFKIIDTYRSPMYVEPVMPLSINSKSLMGWA